MKRYANELIFISRIKRDGTGTIPIQPDEQEELESNIFFDKNLELRCLSLTERTYITHGFNSYVVRLKNPPRLSDTEKRLNKQKEETLT